MDIVSKSVRSKMMASIPNKDTTPEIIVRKFLYSQGIRYRLHSRKLPGKPDIVIGYLKTVVFVNGCFWHRHKGCKFAYTPKSNIQFWQKKFNENLERDNRVNDELKNAGWKTIRIWECELKQNTQKILEKTLKQLNNY